MKHQLLLFKFMLLIALWAAIPIRMRANNALFSHNAVVGWNVLCYTQSFDLNSMTVSNSIEQDQNLSGEVTINENVWVPITPEDIDESDQKDPSKEITFCGTTLEISNKDLKTRYNDTNQKVYLLNNKDHAWYPVKAGNTSAWIPPFRGFVRAPKGTVAAKFAFMVDLDEDNNPTGINELETGGVESGHHTFYTLDGKRMGNNFDALPKGTIYIVNGKKIYKF